MMKNIKRITALIAVTVMVCCAIPFASAQQPRMLTYDRAVQINDYQIVMEFSEPIAINLLGMNRGPHCSIRVVGKNYTLQWDGEVNEGTPLQFSGSLEYADEKHDRLVFTLLASEYGVETINDITRFRGQLGPWSQYSTAMCLEEVPFENGTPVNNGMLDNITTADGEVYLWSNRTGGWDGCYQPITVDYNYKIDLTKTESIANRAEREGSVIALGDARGEAGEESGQEPIKTVTVTDNDPLVFAMWIAAGAVLAVVLAVTLSAVLGRKAGRSK